MDLINTPMSRVTCPNVENPENRAVQFWAFRVGIAPVSKITAVKYLPSNLE